MEHDVVIEKYCRHELKIVEGDNEVTGADWSPSS